ncbi:MAG: Gx transporter family protein [Clostridia bacterium]|nr:Gx transporter family protein [Clostridia bacterium]
MKRKITVRELTLLSLTVAVAMMLSFIESRIPVFVPVPGVKIGLANLAALFALYRLGFRDAALVSAVRVSLSALLFGSPVSFLYSLAGAAVSLILMALLKKASFFSPIGVSVAGGVAHNFAQIAVAALMFDTAALFSYLPVLAITGTLAGTVIGIAGGLLIRKVPTFSDNEKSQ